MPTIEELASLLARSRDKGVHIAPVFESHQTSCWSADKCDPEIAIYLGVWIVNFKQGQVYQATYMKPSTTANFPSYAKNEINYVKAVRSVK